MAPAVGFDLLRPFPGEISFPRLLFAWMYPLALLGVIAVQSILDSVLFGVFRVFLCPSVAVSSINRIPLLCAAAHLRQRLGISNEPCRRWNQPGGPERPVIRA